MISREIENSRQLDGNLNSLLKFLPACRREKRAVDFLGRPLGISQFDNVFPVYIPSNPVNNYWKILVWYLGVVLWGVHLPAT